MTKIRDLCVFSLLNQILDMVSGSKFNTSKIERNKDVYLVNMVLLEKRDTVILYEM